ncbi:hypothetical protein KC980_03200 [candidate division WWE3 bacterium]|uniref:Uncharacterized protein n=1 Tax=candidate division WWE3 bacterium TaxID=2053526 RepID=A0A955J1X3_UNCKA|nr:hypothetical protein [candidate division WWE3 bacterium]
MSHNELIEQDISSLSETQQTYLREIATYDFQRDVEPVDTLIAKYIAEIEARSNTKEDDFQEVLIAVGGLYKAGAAYENALALSPNHLERFHEPQKEIEKGRLQAVGSIYTQEMHLHEKRMMTSARYAQTYNELEVLVNVIVGANKNTKDVTKGMVQESIVTNFIANK